MDDKKLKHYLETTTNIAVIIVALGAFTVFSMTIFNHYQKPQIQAGLQRGQKLEQLPLPASNHTTQTLLIVMSTTCHYCSESIPFYNHLLETQDNAKNPTAIIAVFPNAESEVKDYARQNQLNITSIAAAIDLRVFHVTGTPTMILIDSSGKVQEFWIGKLSKDEEQQVIKALGPNKA